MTSHPNRSAITALLDALTADRIAAGTKRDGTGVAHVTPVINALDALASRCRDLSSPRYLRIAAARDEARITRMFYEVHDQHARGEISAWQYDVKLETARALAAKARTA